MEIFNPVFYDKKATIEMSMAAFMSHSGLEPETPGLKVQCSTN